MNGREAKGEVGQKSVFESQFTEEILRGTDQRERVGEMILQQPDQAQKQSLFGCREQVYAIEIDEPGERLPIGFGEQPLTGVVMVEVGTRMSGLAVQQFCEGSFADARFAFDGGDLKVWSDKFDLADELARGGADGQERLTLRADGGKIEGKGQRLRRF